MQITVLLFTDENIVFFQEFQLSITIPFFVSILVVFILYGIILSKFYKIRKRVETFQKDLTTDVQQKEMKTELCSIVQPRST